MWEEDALGDEDEDGGDPCLKGEEEAEAVVVADWWCGCHLSRSMFEVMAVDRLGRGFCRMF